MAVMTLSVSGSAGDTVAHEMDVEGHKIATGASCAFGASEADQAAGPTPVTLALGSLGACLQSMSRVVAAEQDFEIRAFTYVISGSVDAAWPDLARADAAPVFEHLSVDAVLTTPASQDAVERFGAEVERRSPVTALFSRAGSVPAVRWRRVNAA